MTLMYRWSDIKAIKHPKNEVLRWQRSTTEQSKRRTRSLKLSVELEASFLAFESLMSKRCSGFLVF